MKKNNTLKVVLIAMFITVLLTWIFPIGYFDTSMQTFQTDIRYPMGIFDIFYNLMIAALSFGYIGIYLLIVGAFYGVFEQTGAFRKISDKIAKLFKGKEYVFFATIITLLSVIIAFCGFCYELIFVLPLIASIILLMGYDKVTVALTYLSSITVGIMGSLFASNVAGIFASYLDTNYSDLIWFKIAILIIGIAVSTLYIMLRIKHKDIKKDTDKELIAEKYDLKTKKGKHRRIWPAIVIFDLIIVLMILGAIDYSGAFNIDIFDKFHEAVMAVKIGDYPIFARILGTAIQTSSSGASIGLGHWTSMELQTMIIFSTFIFLATIVLAIIYRIKPNEVFEGYKEGAKKFALGAVLVTVSYFFLVSTTYSPVILKILNPLLTLTNGFNAITYSFSYLVSSIFSVDVRYTADMLIPYVKTLVTDISTYPLIAFISQCMHGLTYFIAPTSFVLLSVITYLKVSYKDWLKSSWVLFIALFVISFILFIINMVIV